ncbi:hypothetical protein GF389_00245 [Candidatus Dojkabacteria bacterium]|nr:hypothetical protein [Candidatus Dojkabacteria bacterium]
MNIAKHRAVMTKILIDIYKDNYLVNKLGFKGGTACYFFHNLPRFSVDLDFNLLKSNSVDDMELEVLITRLTDILQKYGKIEQSPTKRNTLFWLLNYEKEQWNLKVEISTRDFGDEFELKELLGVSMPVMKKEYIFAHKLVALTDRKNPVGRDVFDINFFVKEDWKFVGRIIKERTGMEVENYLESLPDFVTKHFTSKNILDGVGELLDKSKRDHYKVKLLDEVITNLQVLSANYEGYTV